MSENPLRLIQITDTHLGAEPGEKLLGLDTDESLKDVLKLIAARESSARLLVATGDITAHNQEGAYGRLIDYVEQMVGKPLAWLAGNHDSDLQMRRFSAETVSREVVELEHWQIILLNSTVPGAVYGQISTQELTRLRHQLEACSKHALVFVHHQPVCIGSKWMDKYVIRNGSELVSLLQEFPYVRALCWGHVHQEFQLQLGELQLLASPSTCIQFKPGSDNFAVDTEMPGYRWLDLHPNGELGTGVERLQGMTYDIDYASNGY